MLIVQGLSVWRVQIVKKAGFFFTGSHSPSEESGKECLREKSLGRAQSTPEALRGKIFVSKSGVQTTQNALIIHWKSIRGSAHWTNPKGGPQGALKVPLGPYTEEH